MSRTLLLGALVAFGQLQAQQSTVRVLEVTPASAILPTDPVTVTFDRPVVGYSRDVIDPARVASLRPALPVRFDWRDPSTLRLVPTQPWPAGEAVTLTIDTSLVAPDGSRLTSPVRITIRVTGPARRASVPELVPNRHAILPPDGRLRLLYTSPVDTAALAAIARYEFGPMRECARRVVRFRVIQRPIAPNEYTFSYALGYDSVRVAMGRVVELIPASPLPDGCDGDVVLPSLDSLDAPLISYPISSAPAFAFASLDCGVAGDCAASGSVHLTFTVPVDLAAASRAVRVNGETATIIGQGPLVNKWVTLRLAGAAGRVYRITIDSTLTDIGGRRFTGPREITVNTGDRTPRVTHAAGFLTQPRGATPFIRVSHVNVDSAEFEVLEVPRRWHLPVLLGDFRNLDWRSARVVRRVTPLGGMRNAVGATDLSLPELASATPAELIAVRVRVQNGAARVARTVVVTSRGRTTIPMVDTMTTAPAIVQVSNLAVHARLDGEQGAVLVTDHQSGAPVPNAAVTVRSSGYAELARARSDSSGVALVTSAPTPPAILNGGRAPVLVEVERPGDRVLLPVALDHRNSFDASAGGELPLEGWVGAHHGRRALVFTDRDLYRPGERVFLSAVARVGRVEQLQLPGDTDRFRFQVIQLAPSNGEGVIFEREIQFSQFGTGADSFSLGPHAGVGPYWAHLQVRHGDNWVAVNEALFHVAEYRAPEFAVTIAGDSMPRYVGDSLTWRVRGRYLYDAPMRHARVQWGARIMEASPWDMRIPGLPDGFGFGDPVQSWEGRSLAERTWYLNGTGTLDSTGHVSLRMADSVRGAGTFRMSFSVTVEDVNRQTVNASANQLLFGSSHYFAVREVRPGPGYHWWRAGTPVRIEVLTVRPDGSRASGEHITARLVHSRWADSSGTSASGRWVPDTSATWPLVSADTAISLSFTPGTGGYYTLQLSGRDRDGRTVESRIRRYVVGAGGRAAIDGPPTRLVLEADTIDHQSGATASVRFDSPFESADAWVTVEREGLLRQFRQRASRGPNEIRIAITDSMSPSAFVAVLLLNRAPGVAGDSLHLRLRTGMTRVRVDSMIKRLTVSVAPDRKEVEPGADARMNLRVLTSAGLGARTAVTVWAVDAGVLSMGNYQRPEPVDVLQRQYARWLALASTLPSTIPLFQHRLALNDSRMGSLALRGVNRLSEVVLTGVGAEGVAMAAAPMPGQDRSADRFDFRTTAFFRAMVLTDDSGRATVDVRLPHNVTTYRLFAVAIGADDRSGSAESTFVATRPLVVRAALPRFVRPGDTFEAGAVVGIRGRPAGAASVTTEGSGINLTSAATTSVSLDNGSAEARFSWTALDSDSARVRLSASDGINHDAVRAAIPVKPDRFPVARAASGVVRNELTVRLAVPKEIDVSRTRLTIRAGTTPLPFIDEALDYVLLYPYACTEQLLASGRVLATALALHQSGLPVKIDRREAMAMLERVVIQLSERQRSDGAFGYWSTDSWSTPWLSSAVGELLADAASAGIDIPAQTTARLSAYLEQSLDSQSFNPDTTSGTRIQRRQTAYTHYGERLASLAYLRRVGKPRAPEEQQLIRRESLLAWEDRVLLARMLHDAGRTEASEILRRAWQAVGTAGIRADLPDSLNGGGLFPSRVRPLARLVQATVAIDPTHERLGALLERLLSRTAAGRAPWNTQDYATASAAVLAAMEVLPRGTGTLTATMGQQRVTLQTIDGAAADSTIDLVNLLVPAGDSLVLNARLSAQNGPIFWALTTSEVPAAPDTRPESNGVTVERWYERFDNGEPATVVREGDLVRVRVRVTVPSQRDFLAVEDPLPAGLEAVDLTLRTSGLGPFVNEATNEARARRDREAAAGRALGAWDSGWWSPWEHSEKRDDRVTWFARTISRGVYTASYVARATTAGRFVRPPARAEEMYNAAAGGRSEGGVFVVSKK